MVYDVIVVGGGSAGLMAAVAAGQNGARTLLLEKGEKLGRKLGISGGGRCNVTNAGSVESIIRNIPGNGRFLYSPFAVFNNEDIIRFFEGLGIRLKEEDRGRMFPVSDRAQDVVQALVGKVHELGVEIRVNAPVAKVIYGEREVRGLELRTGETLRALCVIVAVGGMSVPRTGSTGDGYAWAREAGHTVTELFPTEVPITSDEDFVQERRLQGISLRNVGLSVIKPLSGKKMVEHYGDILFTHFGLSGPAALRCSQFVVKALKKHEVHRLQMQIDFFPEKTVQELVEELQRSAAAEAKKNVKNLLKGKLPERLLLLLIEKAGLAESVPTGKVARASWHRIATLFKAFPMNVNGTLSLEEAFVTGGGVHLKELEPQTLQSKCMPGLFFCGEILDIHGYTGGYNITAAFSTGFAAGKAAAERSAKLRSAFPLPMIHCTDGI